MPLIPLIVVLLLIGVALYLVRPYVDPAIYTVIIVVIILVVVLVLLQATVGWGPRLSFR